MRAERGFTLLEVVVALLIAGLAFGVLFRDVAGSAQAVAVADRYEQALARARSRLATIGHGLALAPLHRSGEDGHGYRWSVDITLAGSATPVRRSGVAPRGPVPRFALYRVAVSESWVTDAGPRQVRLETEQLGAPPP